MIFISWKHDATGSWWHWWFHTLKYQSGDNFRAEKCFLWYWPFGNPQWLALMVSWLLAWTSLSLQLVIQIPDPNWQLGVVVGGEGVSIWRCRLTSVGIPMLKIRWSWHCLIFKVVTPIPAKDSFYFETGPWFLHPITQDNACHGQHTIPINPCPFLHSHDCMHARVLYI